MNDTDASLYGCASASEVERVFAQVLPSGSTPTALRLDDLMRPFVEECEDAKAKRTKMPKPTIFVCIVRRQQMGSLTLQTDGAPDDSISVIDTIVEMASRLDEGRFAKHQCGISFLQVGNDEGAAEFLRSLDDDLEEQHGVRDIVDCRQWEGEMDAAFILCAGLASAVLTSVVACCSGALASTAAVLTCTGASTSGLTLRRDRTNDETTMYKLAADSAPAHFGSSRLCELSRLSAHRQIN